MIGTAAVLGAVLFGAGGTAAGAVARTVLGRLRRGTRVRAPICEVALAVPWAATGAAWAAGLVRVEWLPALLGLAWLGVAGTAVDVRHHRLPDALTVPAIPAAFVLLLPLGPATLGRAGIGALVAVAAHAGLHLLSPQAMGGGDVKLAGSLGAVLAASSWSAVVLAAGLAAVVTGAVALVVLARGRAGGGAGVPHGPSMLLAGWVVVAGAALGPGVG